MTKIKRTIPILKVEDVPAALAFYTDKLGFRQTFLFQREPDHPAYAGVERDAQQLHLSSFPGDGVSGASVNIDVDDIEALQSELVERGFAQADVEIMSQDWGRREVYVGDGHGNTLRFGEPQ